MPAVIPVEYIMSIENTFLNQFLIECGLYTEDKDFYRYVETFEEEMKTGLRKKESSLRMIPSYIGIPEVLPRNEKVISIDAGGSNLRIAQIRFTEEGAPQIEKSIKERMPGTEKEIGVNDFYSALAESLSPFIEDCNRIGFVFSYPTEISPDRDGKVIKFCKEVHASEAVGSFLGKNLREAVGRSDLEITVLNDTVATLLAGKSALFKRKASGYIGFILGTGTNSAYVDESLYGESTIINCESGAYSGIEQGIIDKELDRASLFPGDYKFEKMIAGAYLGDLTLRTIKKAIDYDLLTESNELPTTLSTIELNTFCFNYTEPSPLSRYLFTLKSNERFVLLTLVDRILERAALLTVVNIAAITKQYRNTNTAFSPVVLSIDGTTYNSSSFIQERIQFYLYKNLRAEMGLFLEQVNVHQATLIGGALAAFS